MKLTILFFIIFITLVDSYRQEIITSAVYVTRPCEVQFIKKYNIYLHHDLLVKTSFGNTYLLHSTPTTGIVVTSTPLSHRWTIKKNITVVNKKTIGGAIQSVGFKNGFTNYVTGGTCIGSTNKMIRYLNN